MSDALCHECGAGLTPTGRCPRCLLALGIEGPDPAGEEQRRFGRYLLVSQIGRGAMGNPWFFRSLMALERGEPDPGVPSLQERHTVWRRHADLVLAHSVERMHVHELRKTLAWYSRGLRGGRDNNERGNNRYPHHFNWPLFLTRG